MSDDLVKRAAVAAALTEAAAILKQQQGECERQTQALGGVENRRDDWHRWLGGDLSLGLAKSRILGLITPDAQAALDRVVAAERDRIEELEAKLAKAMEALGRAKASIENGGGGGVTDVVWLDDPCPETLCDFIDATLAAVAEPHKLNKERSGEKGKDVSDDPRCAKCGHPRSNHPYRHPFVGPQKDDTIKTQADRIEELEAKLAKAVEAAEKAVGHIERIPPRMATARVELCDALAEIKGQAHE